MSSAEIIRAQPLLAHHTSMHVLLSLFIIVWKPEETHSGRYGCACTFTGKLMSLSTDLNQSR